MSILTLIVDDEALAREAIGLRLQSHNRFEIIGEADNGRDAVVLSKNLKPDVIFLDIEMPELNGIEAAKLIHKACSALIVFVTAYQHFALDAFRVNAADYLLKPIEDEQFEETITRVSHKVLLKNSFEECQRLTQLLSSMSERVENKEIKYITRISVDDGENKMMLNVNEIESFTSAKNYLCILHNGKNYLRRGTIIEMESMLNPDAFIKCSRSVIVNKTMLIGKVIHQNKPHLLTKQKNSYPVSRRFTAKANKLFKS